MTAWYNEIDPFCAQWLRNLIAAGHLAPGVVDERDIRDVKPYELQGYAQCHFFVGIGGWSLALRMAGVPDHTPLWTGSCPCQSFSAAGKQRGFADERHLWPAWFHLIEQCKPPIVFGEQVATAIGHGWLDLVCDDLESQGYACGASVLPACSVGAPHLRQRLWFVADRASDGRFEERTNLARRAERTGAQGQAGRIAEHRAAGELADSQRDPAGARRAAVQSREGAGTEAAGAHAEPGRRSLSGIMAHGLGPGLEVECEQSAWDQRATAERGGAAGLMGIPDSNGREQRSPAATPAGHGYSADPAGWDDLEWLPCSDGKSRPTKPGIFPLAHGVSGRVGQLRAYGNAFVPQVAAEFIKAAMDL